MKKWFLLPVIMLLFLLAACGEESSDAPTTAVSDSPTTQQETVADNTSIAEQQPDGELAAGSDSPMQTLPSADVTVPGAATPESGPQPIPPEDTADKGNTFHPLPPEGGAVPDASGQGNSAPAIPPNGQIPSGEAGQPNEMQPPETMPADPGQPEVIPPMPPETMPVDPGQPGVIPPMPPETMPVDPGQSGGSQPMPPEGESIPADPETGIRPIPPVTVPDTPVSGEDISPEEIPPVEQETTETLPPSSGTTASPPQTVIPEITICNHQYVTGSTEDPTCLQVGFQDSICSKCGSTTQALTEALGHSFSDGSCSRCGAADPNPRTVTILVKDSSNVRIPGVTVNVFTNEDTPAGSSVTDNQGRVSLSIGSWWESYQVTLSHIPDGYTASKDSYRFTADNGNIVLEPVAVIDPLDHSRAAYKVGDRMGDFTVTDTDGKTHQLTELLQEKKLVILNFWYCSCVPCKAEFPYFEAVYQHYGEQIEILALNHVDPDLEDIRLVKSQMGLSFPFVQEALGMDKGFDIRSYPVSVFIGKDGTILKIQKDVGFSSEEELVETVAQLIPIS